MKDKIVIKGARENNLKNLNVEIPRDKFVVLTGLSGSGKTSLAFDTIYAEGQRRYIESLSAYARQFLGQMEKPDVDYIGGLSPAISIDQKTTGKNPRSTVGTVTEIYDYLRLLYARCGVPHCHKCGKEIKKQTIDQIVDSVLSRDEGTRVQIMAPVVRGKKGEHKQIFERAKKGGFVRCRVNGEMRLLEEEISLEKTKKHNIEIVVDRIIIKEGIQQRVTDSLETALKLAGGLVSVLFGDEEVIYSQNFACHDCGISLEELSPRSFSFNSPFGACPTCTGLGVLMDIDPKKVLPDDSKSIFEGAFKGPGWSVKPNEFTMARMYFEALGRRYGFDLNTPVRELDKKIVDIILYGSGDEKIKVEYIRDYGSGYYNTTYEGIIPCLQRRYKETTSEWSRGDIERYMSDSRCPDCKGARLRPEILAVTIGGVNIADLTNYSVAELSEFFENLKLSDKEAIIAQQILKEINARVGFLKSVGLDYLTLSRSAATLSGGEAQRIRLATQIGSGLVGVLYILDEPSIGLHQKDNKKLLKTLKDLRDLGNTLIVVEHDEETILEADHVVDIGPGAGINGGEVVVSGTVEDVLKCKKSITGQYLSGKKKIPVPCERREGNGNFIKICGAKQNNLKNIDVSIPLGKFVCITGVSGSGKSSLINEVLYKELAVKLNGAQCVPGECDGVEGLENLDKVIDISQSPIGRTPRSNPATYTGVFTDIREVFATSNEAKMRGYTASRFSFNVKGGRCEACSGDGIIKIEMNFLADVYVPCDVCKGHRYNRETLEVKYKGKNIYEVLDMTIEEGLKFFENQPKIRRKLQTLCDVGLGYVKIGQPSTLLSGGEAQRVKLATELSKRPTGRTVYILDEPTTGLHTADVHNLINVLQRLIEGGNTVIVIEHNLDVIKTADYIIDLGPDGGDRGGTIVACGTPEEVAKVKKSYTGQFLKEIFKKTK
ncbi:MAG: excinuclease ABC subunit UvrA [Clostridia bacterium]|nr:excinuclease ABC subunit UvrA [Clostridia bacterium]